MAKEVLGSSRCKDGGGYKKEGEDENKGLPRGRSAAKMRVVERDKVENGREEVARTKDQGESSHQALGKVRRENVRKT